MAEAAKTAILNRFRRIAQELSLIIQGIYPTANDRFAYLKLRQLDRAGQKI
jgi:phage terminase Nu1 subunit (DNA packaging protein)